MADNWQVSEKWVAIFANLIDAESASVHNCFGFSSCYVFCGDTFVVYLHSSG
jgi:hypothetical protein